MISTGIITPSNPLGTTPKPGGGYTIPRSPDAQQGTYTTAASAHDMLKALAIELAFVVVATMVAGISDSWGTSTVVLMLALLALRGLFEVDIFAAFAQGTTLRSVN